MPYWTADIITDQECTSAGVYDFCLSRSKTRSYDKPLETELYVASVCIALNY